VRAFLHLSGAAARVVGREGPLSSERARDFEAAAWTCDSSRFRRVSGWIARIDLASGLGSAAEWYRARGWL
jgi:nucleoside-diphosphate-sugar epimerase